MQLAIQGLEKKYFRGFKIKISTLIKKLFWLIHQKCLLKQTVENDLQNFNPHHCFLIHDNIVSIRIYEICFGTKI